MDDEKVPVEQVLEDMYNPNGGPVSWAARDYYYLNYATEEEKAEMDRNDRFDKIVFRINIVLIVLLAISIIKSAL